MTKTLKTFEVRIWDKAERWSFDTTIEAKDEFTAVAKARKEYPNKGFLKGGYIVQDVRAR
jgi:hypothetical protein